MDYTTKRAIGGLLLNNLEISASHHACRSFQANNEIT